MPCRRRPAHAWPVPGVDGVELCRATCARHTLARHAHEVLAFGVGTMQGITHRAPPDTLVLIGAGEGHTGRVERLADAAVRAGRALEGGE